jgi:ubiquinone/menaquinone biosynthesis C-methylase UbiE
MSNQASNFVGSVPLNYDEHLGPHIFIGFAEILAEKTVSEQPQKVLELAAGTGIVSRVIRDTLPESSSLVITDLNEPMLDSARSKFTESDNVDIRQANAQELPFDDAAFDVIACQFGVMFFPDKEQSYREAYRVLKPGGKYILNVWDALEFNPFAQIAHNTVATFFPENPPGFYKVPFGYRDAVQIEQSLKDAGFANVTHEVINITAEISSAEDFATGLVFGNPLNEEIQDRGGNSKDVHLAIANAIEENLGSSMPLQAVFFTAEK